MTKILKKVQLSSEQSTLKSADPTKGTQINPYSQEEMAQLQEEGTWNGGYVEGMGLIVPMMAMLDSSGSNINPYIQGSHLFEFGMMLYNLPIFYSTCRVSGSLTINGYAITISAVLLSYIKEHEYVATAILYKKKENGYDQIATYQLQADPNAPFVLPTNARNMGSCQFNLPTQGIIKIKLEISASKSGAAAQSAKTIYPY